MAENSEIPNQNVSVDIKDHQSSVHVVNNVGKQTPHATATPTPSFDSFLQSVALFGTIMFLYYLCDDDHFFPAIERTYSRDLFWFLVLLLFAVAAGFTRRETAGKILNREQTEEWKGWMQVMFVWYHYFKATETYNAIRVFIAAYVWMTGFGKLAYIDIQCRLRTKSKRSHLLFLLSLLFNFTCNCCYCLSSTNFLCGPTVPSFPCA